MTDKHIGPKIKWGEDDVLLCGHDDCRGLLGTLRQQDIIQKGTESQFLCFRLARGSTGTFILEEDGIWRWSKKARHVYGSRLDPNNPTLWTKSDRVVRQERAVLEEWMSGHGRPSLELGPMEEDLLRRAVQRRRIDESEEAAKYYKSNKAKWDSLPLMEWTIPLDGHDGMAHLNDAPPVLEHMKVECPRCGKVTRIEGQHLAKLCQSAGVDLQP